MEIEMQPHEVQQQLKNLGDSVSLIMEIMAKNERTEKSLEKVTNNYRHIFTACDYPWFSTYNMEFYKAAAAQGQAWVNGA